VERRAFIGLLTGGLLAAPLAAGAQQRPKVHRIGALGNLVQTAPQVAPSWKGFMDGMREHGYSEGRNFVMEYRAAEGKPERSAAFAGELVALKVDLLVAAGSVNVRAAKQATNTIPIVFVYVIDPILGGFIESYARPGGNITGVAFGAGIEIVGKHLELLKEALPRASRVAVLSDPLNPPAESLRKETQAAAARLGMTLQFHEVMEPGELESVFAAMTRARSSALLVLPHPFALLHTGQIADLATKSRLPAIYPFREAVEVGGLMAYAANAPDMYRRAAAYVDKIFKGAKPGDLPVEQPTQFELIINLKTAKALGLTIPPSLLARADQVIE